ncbi:hypothetical protein V8F20_005860 [Naviculisporaceae sp. PSN 640]
MAYPIIDSHIHIYPASEAENLLPWMPISAPVTEQTQYSVDEFKAASSSSSDILQGFIAIEAGTKNDLSKDWKPPLKEVSFFRRVITGQPRPGDGHPPADKDLCLGIVPWAPLNLGPEKLEEYLAKAEEEAGPETWSKVKGFRYLLQDQPHGTAKQAGLIEGLKLLGRKGFVFDVGVDHHRRGRAQLDDLVEMIDRAHEGVDKEEEKVVFVLNHLCKPDITILNYTTDPSFQAWRNAMFTLSKCKKTYIKLSGLFSEMTDKVRTWSAHHIVDSILPWLTILLVTFGPKRIMFGSDWPVCTIGVDDANAEDPEADNAWEKWRKVVEKMCDIAGLSDSDQKMIWAGTAREAYHL